MKIKWKLFRKSFPLICTKCDTLSNMKREYCEKCGEQNSFREVTKEDHAKFKEE
ncbi:MAG: hypothetical protein ACTSPU_08820 [Promethearchaeota archaeon]|nr:hypothetical protein [Candidatus Lokiarchaeota archaeon]